MITVALLGGTMMLWAVLPTPARAGQVLLIDSTYTHDTKVGSHFPVRVRPDTPANWRMPDNYAEGTVYLELQILKKPNETTKFVYQLCMLGSGAYVCTNFHVMSEMGTHRWSQAFPLWHHGDYDYSRKPTGYALIVKDERGVLVESGPQYYPMDLHTRAWVVSKGDTFHPPDGGVAAPDAATRGDDARETGAPVPGADDARGDVAHADPDAAVTEQDDARGAAANTPRPADLSTVGADGTSSGCDVGRGARPSGLWLLLTGLVVGLALRRRKYAASMCIVGLVLAVLGSGCSAPGGRGRDPDNNPGGMGGESPATGGSAGGAGQAPAAVATGRLARLSHTQWENTVRDLLRLDKTPGLSGSFTGDAITGFDNNADQLLVSDGLRGDYERAAETLATRIATDPAALAKILPASLPKDLPARVRGFVQGFGLRAYRRPLAPDEVEDYVALFAQGANLFAGVDPFAAGAELFLAAVLQSPHFLYRTELGTKSAGGRVALDDYELGAKLSYALANTMPDDTLLAAAAVGELRAPGRLAAEATRLFDGAQGDNVLDHFHSQVFVAASYAQLQKDEKLFPVFAKYKATLPTDLLQETLLFARDNAKQQRGVADLLTATHTFANNAIAAIYGLSTAALGANTYTRVELDPNQRSGLLTRLGFLASRAGPTDPHSIQRGVFVNQVILCRNLPPPVAVVPPLPAQTTAKTNREVVELHTGKGTCGETCHYTLINPPGFAFENYDAVGAYRTLDHGVPVNSTGIYTFEAGPRSFANGIEFSRQVAESPEAHRCYSRNLLSYLHGREIREGQNADAAWTASLGGRSLNKELNIRSMILELVTGAGFTTRSP